MAIFKEIKIVFPVIKLEKMYKSRFIMTGNYFWTKYWSLIYKNYIIKNRIKNSSFCYKTLKIVQI